MRTGLGLILIFGYLVTVTIVVEATLARHYKSGRVRSNNQVTLVLVMRILALSAGVFTVGSAIPLQPIALVASATGLIVAIVIGEVVWRATGRGAGARQR